MQFRFHVSGGLEDIDAFWEARGLDRSKERFLFAGYSRKQQPHTIYLQWMRSHDECCDVLLGIEARPPAQVWRRRPVGKEHRLKEKDFREFIEFARDQEVPWGIKARYAYPWSKSFAAGPRLPAKARVKSLSIEILEEKDRVALTLTLERSGATWRAIVEPTARFPFPKGKDFFTQPFETRCSLAQSLAPESE